jgi:hypothetical protein
VCRKWLPFEPPVVPRALKRCRAVMHAPAPTGTTPLDCAALLPLRLAVDATVEFVDPASLHIMARGFGSGCCRR